MSTDSQLDNSSRLGVITRTEPIHARYNIVNLCFIKTTYSSFKKHAPFNYKRESYLTGRTC
jgi:hypothetical protein